METLFWNIAGEYNKDTWIFQIAIFLIELFIIFLIYKKPSKTINLCEKIFLAICFTWIAVVYFILHGSSEFNNLLNAIPFGIIALLWIVDIFVNKVKFTRNKRYDKIVSILYIIWFTFPIFSFLIGREWPKMFGIVFPCNLITFTLILLISYSKNVNYILLIILIALAVPGGFINVFEFGVWEDIIMIFVGIVATVIFSKIIFEKHQCKRESKKI
ncbi:hypothetical protein H7E67_02920 [Clostridium gasigenes]|uniref:DUF6064 family protein n=1 Tax=Clostridium gasigenes TaxID=94869 RepID=UPI001624B2F4|nr:DUF6064 family protein [Clostridium gasigenes]MBB6622375.1 hypothetical protein [Clostridium gasigenes]MBU3109488.1 hypothetical protein [Clostridium gasigenes]